MSGGNPILLTKGEIVKKRRSVGEPLAKFRLFPSVSGTEEITKKRFQWGDLLNFFVSGVIFGQKLIQKSYNLIYQPSEKSWQNISLYQELYRLFLDLELLFVVLIPYLSTKEGPFQANH